MASEEAWIDQTTYYSVLGLTTDASESQIKKAYRKIAMAIHPDKNKSSTAAEMFKLVSHAQSVLTDKETRRDYNVKLISKGLHTYIPKRSKLSSMVAAAAAAAATVSISQNPRTPTSSPQKPIPRSSPAKNTTNVNSSLPKHATPRPQTSLPRRSKPYEQQPYGFGVENEPVPKSPNSIGLSTVGRDKLFKAKSYQHQRPAPPHAEGQESKLRGSTYSSRFAATASDLQEDKETAYENYASKPFQEGKRTKFNGDKIDKDEEDVTTSPFLSNYQRHYARTMHHDKEQNRRSTSPVKNQPNSTADSLQDIKNIMERLKMPKDGVSKVSNSETKNVPSSYVKPPEPSKQTEPVVDELFKTGLSERRQTHPQSIPIKRAAANNGKVETPNGDDFTSIKLSELESVLPNENQFFNMQQVSDTLEGVRIKRPKTERNDTLELNVVNRQTYISEFAQEVAFESLSRPVNEPLPRIYKPEPLSLQELGVDASIAHTPLPAIPVLQINSVDRHEVLRMTQIIKSFQSETNRIKRKILDALLRRSTADDLFQDRLSRVENTAILLHSKKYDIEIAERLQKLQDRQRLVSDSFATLMNSVYQRSHAPNGR
ncbi:LANO_0G04456g1_1 [Lachancea nothofagi CBS 11611]|uniref:LANO_0G04456g1_1 n=1 Tax=Lachancea nothofagi CBS 11611 TaxID=1266666 RepID=A0A1G4KG47_9SACH|nr:LANO_0G04456g1_1 [Lachancea nothofagi CBS 11611]